MVPRAQRRRLGGAALLIGVAALALGVATPHPAGVAVSASAAGEAPADVTCPLPPFLCPTPTPTRSHTPTPAPRTPTPTAHTPAPPSSSSSGSSSSSSPPFDSGTVFLPTLPPESPAPGSPPPPPELSVENVILVPAGGDTVRPGLNVLVEATCEARRGTDTYSVPHANVTFSVAAPAGSTATVNPAEANSGDTGVATVSVDVGDAVGDVVLSAASGNATGQVTIHVSADAPSASASPSPSPSAAAALPGSTRTVDSGGTTGGRAVAVALLVALGAAVLATTLFRLGLLPRIGWRRRRRKGVPETPLSSS